MPGFEKANLTERYDVESMSEDEWHSYTSDRTVQLLKETFHFHGTPPLCLNAGSGVYALRLNSWKEIPLDLFVKPVRRRHYAVCATVEALPFRVGSFGGVVCTGEVLAYCDPSAAIVEFARVLAPMGTLLCDFGNSRSFRYWLKPPFGRAADQVTDYYNGSPEKIWIYHPGYVESLLSSAGFSIQRKIGAHTWSALARRLGLSMACSVRLQRAMEWFSLPTGWSDVLTIIAVRTSGCARVAAGGD